tara:strand:- start:7419 stop:7928 length:510 start_codon:yes stop_codon:yes gene_type:complete
MNIANIKLPIAVIGVIVAQAFGIIWYMAQLDSTVKDLDSSVAVIQAQATTVDVAVLKTDLDNLKIQFTKLVEGEVDEFDPTEILNSITELETKVTWMMNDWGPKINKVGDDLDDFDERLSDIETVQAVIDNEMRTIMTDHHGFAEVLAELQKSGILPTGEKRAYGSYGD